MSLKESIKNLELVRLKKIEIFGFKSFADKIELRFDQGVTAVVGPNGCGKSNIADAFRWVLGEQSAKSMRGSKMPDVIFAGTATRKPLNFAEVTITLCNECGRLPIEFAEVSVTRRLHRNGESDYFINRNPVRMRDIQTLLLDSGMGKNAFSIFEQGKIDQVIQFTPLERRSIFEEAAGILRFLQRKREALKKLEDSDLNQERVKDIQREEEKQIIVLKEQSEKARLFKENKRNLELFEKILFRIKMENLSKRGKEAEKKESEKKAIADSLQITSQDKMNVLEEEKINLLQTEKILKETREHFFKAKSEKELKAQEKKSDQERLLELKTREEKLQKELQQLKEKRLLTQNEVKSLLEKQKETGLEFSQDEEKLKIQRDALSKEECEIENLRSKKERGQKDLLQLIQKESHLESELKQNSVRLEGLKEREAQDLLRQNKIDQTLIELSEMMVEKKNHLKESSDSIDRSKVLFSELEAKIQKVIAEIKEQKKQLEECLARGTALKASQKVLQDLKKEREGFSDSGKRLLKESEKEKSPLYQKIYPLYEFIKLKEGKEKALSASLRLYSQTLFVKEKKDFSAVLELAEKEKLQNFSLYCLENQTLVKNREKKLPFKAENSSSSSLFEFEEGSDEWGLSSHFLKKISLVDEERLFSLEVQKDVAQVSEKGNFLDLNGVLFFQGESENRIFLREAELQKLPEKIAQEEAFIQQLNESLKMKEMQKNQFEAERLLIDKTMRKEEMRLVEINFGLQKLISDLALNEKEKKQLDEKKRAAEELKKKLELEIANQSHAHLEVKSKLIEVQKTVQQIQDTLLARIEYLKSSREELKVSEISFQKRKEEKRKLTHALDVFEIKEIEHVALEKRLSEDLKLAKGQESLILSKDLPNIEALSNLETRVKELEALVKGLEQKTSLSSSKIGELEKEQKDTEEKLRKIEKEINSQAILLAEIKANTVSLEEELKEHYNIDFEALMNMDLPEELLQSNQNEIEKRIRFLKQQLAQSGDINMRSIEELVTHQARFKFLDDQIKDLEGSRDELLSIIGDLDEESKKMFKITFELIRENFKKNFKILFNGGEADLEFVESADILEAGIEISAKPPGKQMRSINLLSGGEKCLTAMALLFAIFEVKPVPFCLLDEIDAPLDDSNVERFVAIVREFIDRCQFIIITHNKRTMAIADLLYGVSMEEKGVSKLLSVDFSKAKEIT